MIAVDHDACILCDRCVRACDDLQGNDVIGRSGKGYATRIAFDLDDPMGASSCVTCGECVAACPTGALTNKPIHDVPIRPRDRARRRRQRLPLLRRRLRAHLLRRPRARRDRLRRGPRPAGLAGPAVRQGPLRLGLRRLAAAADRAADPRRRVLPEGPAVRRRHAATTIETGDRQAAGASPAAWCRTTRCCRTSARPAGTRRSTWWPAGCARCTPSAARPASPGFGSAKCSNEEAYLFQKLLRTGVHAPTTSTTAPGCATPPAWRRCSRASAPARSPRRTATSTNADVTLITGSNATANHPVASSFFKQARRDGTTIIYVDPRADKLADHADIFCQLKPGTDVAFYNAVMHEIIRLGLVDETYVAERTSNYEALARTVADYPPERGEQITGVPADVIRAGRAGSGARRAPASSSGAWGSPSTPPAPTTPAA